jgi:hypothetical protein
MNVYNFIMTSIISKRLPTLALLAGCAAGGLHAQIAILDGRAASPAEVSIKEAYRQNFDTLSVPSATKPKQATELDWKNNGTLPGWFRDVANSKGDFSGSGAYTDAPVFFNYGPDGKNNRSIGFRCPQGLYSDAAVAVVFLNKTEKAYIKGVKVAYTGRQWRRHSAAASTLVVGWREFGSVAGFDAGKFAPRTKPFWMDAPDTLTFIAPQTKKGYALDGTLRPYCREFPPVEILFDRPVPPGECFAIRWYSPASPDASGNALAVDDVKIEFIK